MKTFVQAAVQEVPPVLRPVLRPVLIAGPTASGKSALALRVAERDGGVVINADALQVYACWRILTARPEEADLARAPHRLYGHVAADAAYSVGAWLRALAPVLEECRLQGLRPILVGGTGLYLDAATRGLAEIPPIPAEVRRRSQSLLDAGRLDALLDALDPETRAALDRRNPMRIQRAWEVQAATGRGLLDWRRSPGAPLLPEADRIVLDGDTGRLNERIAARFDAMLARGALAEIAAFRDAGLSLRAPSGRALGALELARHLSGEMSLAEAREAALTATRRYAKRQRTWFRNRFAEWNRFDPIEPSALARIPRP